VPTWELDRAVTTKVKEMIAANGKISGEVTPLIVSSPDKDTLIATARAQGFDAVLAVLPERTFMTALLFREQSYCAASCQAWTSCMRVMAWP